VLTTELAILFPIILVVVLAIFQAALWAHAGAIAQAAADHGAEVAASFGADGAAGESAALDLAAKAGTIGDVVAQTSDDPGSEFVTVQVSGTYPSLFGRLEVHASATTVRERVVP